MPSPATLLFSIALAIAASAQDRTPLAESDVKPEPARLPLILTERANGE